MNSRKLVPQLAVLAVKLLFTYVTLKGGGLGVVGDKIRDLRKKSGLTQEQLAGNELTKSYVSQVERGRIRPSRKALEIIARRLSKPLGYFLDNDDDLRTVDVLLKASDALMLSHRLDEAMVGLNEAQHLAERIGRDDIRAQIETAMGRAEQQRHDYAKAMRHFKVALALLSVEEQPDQVVKASFDLGQAAEKAELFHEAAVYFHRSVEAARTQRNPKLLSEALLHFGDFCFRDGKWLSALTLYQECAQVLGGWTADAGLAVRIVSTECRMGRGTVGRAVTAAATLTQVTGSPITHALLASDLSCCFIQLQEYERALTLIESAISSAQAAGSPACTAKSLMAALALGQALHDPDLARRYIAYALEQPDSPTFSPAKALAFSLAADFAQDTDQAYHYVLKALQHKPDDPTLKLKHAILALKVGRPQAAESLAAVMPDYPADPLPVPSFVAIQGN